MSGSSASDRGDLGAALGRVKSVSAALALACLALFGPEVPGATAQESTEAAIEAAVAAASGTAAAAKSQDAPAETPEAAASSRKECKPNVGCVTNLPLPRYVTLKGDEGNARRGPGLTHRIDWVFTRPGMPLRVTAEYENWRRIEDQEGAGGWVHYALLSGVRSVLVTTDMAEIRDAPNASATTIAQSEMGVVAKILQCNLDWCRISVSGSGERGWVQKADLWGVDPEEIID